MLVDERVRLVAEVIGKTVDGAGWRRRGPAIGRSDGTWSLQPAGGANPNSDRVLVGETTFS